MTNCFTPKITAPASDATATIEDTDEHEVLHHNGVNENMTEIAVELNQFNETTSAAAAGISVPVANSPSAQNSDEFCKGKKINLDWLLQVHHCLSVLKEKYGDRLRLSVTCSVCAAYEDKIKRFSSNGKEHVMRITDQMRCTRGSATG